MCKFRFSIIIPHYNIPDLLIRCLKSIPIREDIQVIVVDDCSPNSDNYLNLYPELSRPYLEYYKTPIGGSAGRARNVGLDHARGKWLIFLDADDMLSDNAETLLMQIKDRPEDIIFFQTKSVMSDDLTISSNRNCFIHHFEKYFRQCDDTWLRFYFDALWGKLIKKDLVDRHKIRFDEVRYGNDAFFSVSAGTFAKEVAVEKAVLYINTERAGSLDSAKKKGLNEWQIRYDEEIRILSFLDAHGVRFERFGFADSLIYVSKISKWIFFKEFIKLSFKNKYRFTNYCFRVISNKVKKLYIGYSE